ncbi:hypothetical protein CCHL11_03119 [Colletotrichum chlorophyti]|uniref:F-box domain-containing protein n=1 Tax=Colletotrichum chlorophyti TaxID=708187 RepID=A0A1Q8RGI8_9PEZI|nr:hypothetical protein CCHL11_03119 [Colletotrichum chlorophyti]
MDTLPQEVVDQIASGLHRHDLKNILLLTKTFQIAAEKYSDAFKKCKLYPGDLDKFVTQFRGPRFCWLQEVDFQLQWPEGAPGDSKRDATARDECLSNQIHSLFSALKTLEDPEGPQGTVHLKITSPEETSVSDDQPTELLSADWIIRLQRPEQLPVLRCIGRLRIGYPTVQRWSGPHGKFDLRIFLDLSAKLPNLSNMRAELFDEHHCDAEIDRTRIESRERFSRAEAAPLQMKRAELIFQGERAHHHLDHSASMPNLIRAGGRDPFSSSLGVVCRHLTQLQLTAIVDQFFFWPSENGAVTWPNLESLEVKFHPVTPSGSWYFVGPRGEGRGVQGYSVSGIEYTSENQSTNGGEDEDHSLHIPCQPSLWRVEPNPDTLYPMLLGFAKAAARMPRLREAMIWSPIRWSPGNQRSRFGYNSAYSMLNSGKSLGWGIGYNAPGSDEDDDAFEHEDSDDDDIRIFEWRTARWEPNDEIKAAFHEIGREQYGDELDDCWDPGANQEDLFFEGFCFGAKLS